MICMSELLTIRSSGLVAATEPQKAPSAWQSRAGVRLAPRPVHASAAHDAPPEVPLNATMWT